MQSKSIYKILTRRLLFKRLSQLLVLLFLLVSGYLFITNNAKTSRAEIINNGNTITINGGRYVVAPDGALYGNDPTVINEQLSNLSGKDVVLSSAARLIFSGADATTPTPVNINSLTLQGGSEITHVGPGPTDRLLVGDKIQTDADNATAFSTDTAYELNGDMRGRIVPRDYFGVILEGWFVVPNGITTIAVQFDDAARIYLGQSDTLSATVSLPAYIINADVGANGYSTLNGLTPGGIYHYKIYYLNSLNNGHLRFCTTYNKGETCSVALSNNNFFISKEAAEQNLASGRARAKLQLYDDSIDPRNFE